MSEIDAQKVRERLGNIDRIRDLLFGEKMSDYEGQFQNCQNRIDKLESQLKQFEREHQDRLTLLENSLSAEIRSGFDSLEQKIRYLDLTSKEKISTLKQEIDYFDRVTSARLEDIESKFKTKNNFIEDEIKALKQEINTTFEGFKKQTISEIKKDFLEIKNDKISRTDLGEILFEICLKLRGDELISNLKKNTNNYLNSSSLSENKHFHEELNEREDRQTV